MGSGMTIRSPKRFRLSLKLFSAFFSTLLALLACELLVRWLDVAPVLIPIDLSSRESPFRPSDNKILGYELRKNYRGDGPTGVSYVQTNSIGQRDIERDVVKAPGVLRTIVLGDSVVQGMGIYDTDQTLTRQLEIIYDDPTASFLNFGVDGYCTRAEVELLEVKGLALNPDRVIVVFVENDFNNFNPHNEHLAHQRPQTIDRLFRSSSVFRCACVRFNLFGFGIEADPIRWNSGAIGNNNVVDGLSRLKELSEASSFQVMIVIWPKFLDGAIVDPHRMPNSDELIIERLAKAYDIPAVRLSGYFRKHWETAGGATKPRLDYTNGDMMHPSVLGCRVAAESLKTILDSPGAFSKPSQSVNPVANQHRAGIEAAHEVGTKHKPTYYRLMINDGVALESKGRLAEAEQFYKKAIKVRPEMPHAYYSLGVLYESQGKVARAETQYLKAVRCDFKHLESRYNLAMLYVYNGELESAATRLREAIEIQPQFINAQFNLGLVYRDLNETDLAVKQFHIVLGQDPRHPGALESLAEIQAK